jgi:hypothetical protein
MADTEQQTPVAETPVDDVEMGDSAAGAGEETGLTELEPEAPKLMLFAEYVMTLLRHGSGIARLISIRGGELGAPAMCRKGRMKRPATSIAEAQLRRVYHEVRAADWHGINGIHS